MTSNSYTPEFMSRQEAAALLGVSVETVDRLIATGVLTRYRIQSRWIRVQTGQVLELQHLPREWLERC